MRGLACGCVVGLLAIVPAVGLGDPRQLQPLPPPFRGPDVPLAAPTTPYAAPTANGPVVELLDEGVEPLFPQLINDGGFEAGTIAREGRDVFAGVEAVRVTPMQKYRSAIPGWNFKIVEKPALPPGPKAPGEYRYLRFAWKKAGGAGIMVQLHDPLKSWHARLFAGQNVMGWAAKPVSEKLPGEWELVTYDLFKEFGAATITGIAFTPFDGTSGLFDHILLGRTVEDLDRHTAAALGKVKPAKPLAGKERDALWADLIGADAKKAAAALRLFLATAPDQVAFVRGRLADVPDKDQAARVRKLIQDLDANDFDTREAATDELAKLGPAVIDAVRELARSGPNDEVKFRARVVLKKLGEGSGTAASSKADRLSRVVRVLERAGPPARELLQEIADGKLAPEVAGDANAALARLPKTP